MIHIEKKILHFDISMDYLFFMAVTNSFENIKENFSGEILVHRRSYVIKQISQIIDHQIHNEVEAFFIFIFIS